MPRTINPTVTETIRHACGCLREHKLTGPPPTRRRVRVELARQACRRRECPRLREPARV